MSDRRLRSNAQVRSAGVDGSLIVLVAGLLISGLVLLTLLGTRGEGRRARGGFDEPRPVRNAEFGR